MPHLSQHKLEQFFDDYGWNLESTGPGTWQTGFAGSQRYFPMSVQLSKTTLSLTVCPILERSLWDRAGADKYHKILQLNHELQMVKLGVDPKGALCLICQIVVKDISFSIFCQSLEVLGYYCDELSQILAFMDCDTLLTC